MLKFCHWNNSARRGARVANPVIRIKAGEAFGVRKSSADLHRRCKLR
jgi:hypothetical protein